jgi:hypothetical protein
MTKNKKLVFNLSIKDLKDLGILKKKKRRRKKYIKKRFDQYGNAIKSDSSHMSNPVAFQNMRNLQSDNLKLTNEALEKKAKEPATKTESTNLIVHQPNNKSIEDKINEHKDYYDTQLKQGRTVLSDLYKRVFSQDEKFNKKRNYQFTNPRAKDIYNNPIRDDTFTDNIDVATTDGSDAFKPEADKVPIIQPAAAPIATETVVDNSPIIAQSDEPIVFTNNPLHLKKAATPAPTTETNNTAASEQPAAQPTKKASSHKSTKISKTPTITINPLVNQTKLSEMKSIYTDLMLKSNKTPDPKILDSTTVTPVTTEIRNKFNSYYNANLTKESKKNKK